MKKIPPNERVGDDRRQGSPVRGPNGSAFVNRRWRRVVHSNLVLDELDRELERRGHRFVRYADDCNLYVRSERAGNG